MCSNLFNGPPNTGSPWGTCVSSLGALGLVPIAHFLDMMDPAQAQLFAPSLNPFLWHYIPLLCAARVSAQGPAFLDGVPVRWFKTDYLCLYLIHGRLASLSGQKWVYRLLHSSSFAMFFPSNFLFLWSVKNMSRKSKWQVSLFLVGTSIYNSYTCQSLIYLQCGVWAEAPFTIPWEAREKPWYSSLGQKCGTPVIPAFSSSSLLLMWSWKSGILHSNFIQYFFVFRWLTWKVQFIM